MQESVRFHRVMPVGVTGAVFDAATRSAGCRRPSLWRLAVAVFFFRRFTALFFGLFITELSPGSLRT